jgi:glycosyltransferase involved in cell wall biosynthesis
VTVLNAHAARGSRLLLQLAAAMPHVSFLGMRGRPAYEDRADSVAAINLPNVQFSNCTAADFTAALAASHTILVPSATEAHGALALQALAAGLPVIAVDTPILRESLGAGATLFAPFSEPEVWAGALSRLRESSLCYEQASARALQWSRELQRNAAVQTHRLSHFFSSIADSGV